MQERGGDECVTFADGARLVFWVWSHHHQRQQKAIEEDTIVTEIRVCTAEKRSGDGVSGGEEDYMDVDGEITS